MPRCEAMRPKTFTYGAAVPASYLPIMFLLTPAAAANSFWVIRAFSLASRIFDPRACRQDCTLSLASTEKYLGEDGQFCIDICGNVNYHVLYMNCGHIIMCISTVSTRTCRLSLAVRLIHAICP